MHFWKANETDYPQRDKDQWNFCTVNDPKSDRNAPKSYQRYNPEWHKSFKDSIPSIFHLFHDVARARISVQWPPASLAPRRQLLHIHVDLFHLDATLAQILDTLRDHRQPFGMGLFQDLWVRGHRAQPRPLFGTIPRHADAHLFWIAHKG